MTLEWQVAAGSHTAHIIDTDKPEPKRSGPRALCKRHPQRNAEYPWFTVGVESPGAEGAFVSYNLRPCEDCKDVLPILRSKP